MRLYHQARLAYRARRTAARSRRRGHGEPELDLLAHLVPRGRLAVDIGANKGLYSLPLASLCSRVVAFEPNPRLAGRLRLAVPRNVSVRERALSNTAGEARFFVPLDESGHWRPNIGSLEQPGERSEEIVVERGRLDDEGLTDIGMIKIDVEGHEGAVIEGAMATIRRDRPVMLIEILHKTTPQASAVMAALAGADYAALACQDGALRFFGDDITAVTSKNLIFLPRETAREG